jgi:hypothetical protein
MCIGLAKQLKFPLENIKIKWFNWNECMNLLHYSSCQHTKRKRSKEKARYDEDGVLIIHEKID